MALQSQVNIDIAGGVTGQKATLNPAVYTVENYLSDGKVKAGAPCALVSGKPGFVTLYDGTGTFVGIAERVIAASAEESTDVYPEGAAVTVMVKGDLYVLAGADVTAEAEAAYSAADGYVATGTAVTGWKYKTAASKGDIVVISSWN